MNLSRLDELQKTLLSATDFSTVWRYFLDTFGDHDEFMKLGQPARHELLLRFLDTITLELYSDSVVSEPRMFYLAEQRFLHGTFNLGGRFGGLFYFENTDTGLVVIGDLAPSHEVKYARFRAQPVRSQQRPSNN